MWNCISSCFLQRGVLEQWKEVFMVTTDGTCTNQWGTEIIGGRRERRVLKIMARLDGGGEGVHSFVMYFWRLQLCFSKMFHKDLTNAYSRLVVTCSYTHTFTRLWWVRLFSINLGRYQSNYCEMRFSDSKSLEFEILEFSSIFYQILASTRVLELKFFYLQSYYSDTRL